MNSLTILTNPTNFLVSEDYYAYNTHTLPMIPHSG